MYFQKERKVPTRVGSTVPCPGFVKDIFKLKRPKMRNPGKKHENICKFCFHFSTILMLMQFIVSPLLSPWILTLKGKIELLLSLHFCLWAEETNWSYSFLRSGVTIPPGIFVPYNAQATLHAKEVDLEYRCHSMVGPMVSNQWKPLKNHHHQWLPHQKPLIPIVVFQLFIYWQIPPYLGYSLLKRVQQAVVWLTVPFIHPISVIQSQNAT